MMLVVFGEYFFLFILIIGHNLNVMDLPFYEASMAKFPKSLAIET